MSLGLADMHVVFPVCACAQERLLEQLCSRLNQYMYICIYCIFLHSFLHLHGYSRHRTKVPKDDIASSVIV